jgi:hypothetical protein
VALGATGGLDQVRGKDEVSVLALLEVLASIARWQLLVLLAHVALES